jgi:hypothetical protein
LKKQLVCQTAKTVELAFIAGSEGFEQLKSVAKPYNNEASATKMLQNCIKPALGSNLKIC